MNYFYPQMYKSYKLFKLANEILKDNDKVFYSLYENLLTNKNFKQFCDQSNFIQKNNSYILLFKFKNTLKYIQQIVLQFDVDDKNIVYDISIYCKQQTLDNKFYYPMENILNNSSKTFDNGNQKLYEELKEYFNNVFNKYFQIYRKNVDNGLFV